LVHFTSSRWKEIWFFEPAGSRIERRERLAGWCEAGVLVCLVILSALLPYADITTSREIGIVFGLLFWLGRMALSGRWEFIRTPLDLPLALLTAAGLLSIVWAVDPGYTLHELRGEMLKGILIYYLAVNNLRTESRAKAVIAAMLAGALIMDFYGVIDYTIHYNYWTKPWVREISLHRGSQELGTYLLQTAPYLLLGFFWLKRRVARAILAAFLILHLTAAYLTFSRITLLAILFEAGLIIFLWNRFWKVILVILAILLVYLTLFSPRPILVPADQAPEELRFGRFGLNGLDASRFALWRTALNDLAAHPFQGIGFGRHSFAKKYPEWKKINTSYWHAHNTFINLAHELGLQGLAVFCFLLYRLFRGLWPGRGRGAAWVRGNTAGLVAAAVWVMTAGYFLRNLTDDLYSDDCALLFWLLVGCAFSLKRFAWPLADRKPGA